MFLTYFFKKFIKPKGTIGNKLCSSNLNFAVFDLFRLLLEDGIPAKAGILRKSQISNMISILYFLILIDTVFAIPAQAKTLTVQAPFKTMTLNYDRKKISLKGYRLGLSLKRKNCNGHILDRFRWQMDSLLKSKTLLKNRKEKESLEIQFNSRKLFAPPRSKETRWLLNLPLEVQRMKLEGIFICRKK